MSRHRTRSTIDEDARKVGPPGAFAKGPRNLPQPSARKKAQKVAKRARKVNRGVYSGQ